MQKIDKKLLILFLFLIIGFALRFYAFDKKSLWLDEIYTFQDSRYGIKDQIDFYKENPAHLHPPLFFILTHIFHPFKNLERELRIIPLIFGTLSIPMIYILAKEFSSRIALPCAMSLTFMTYHIYLSQEGRSYSLLLFLSMVSLLIFMKYLKTHNGIYLPLLAFFCFLLFFTSYTSIPFIFFSQMLWFYRIKDKGKTPLFPSFFYLNGLLLTLVSPWILFLLANYKGQEIMDPLDTEGTGSLSSILYGISHDWTPHPPLTIISLALLILFPILAKERKNAVILLFIFFMPMMAVYLFCILFNFTHFVTSRYFISALPIFLISLFLSIESLEAKLLWSEKTFRLQSVFLLLFIASNLTILPLYYRSEKQDLRGLVSYLKSHLRKGDNIYVTTPAYIPALLHYFDAPPKGRYHLIDKCYDPKTSKDDPVYMTTFPFREIQINIFAAHHFGSQFLTPGGRLWIIVTKPYAKLIQKQPPFVLKGYFDGSFLNFNRFPTDASMYLFLWDPSSPEEKGIDLPDELLED